MSGSTTLRLGNVGLRAGDARGDALGVPDGLAAREYPAKRPGLVAYPVLAQEVRGQPRQVAVQFLAQAGEVSRMHTVEPFFGAAANLVFFATHDLLPAA